MGPGLIVFGAAVQDAAKSLGDLRSANKGADQPLLRGRGGLTVASCILSRIGAAGIARRGQVMGVARALLI